MAENINSSAEPTFKKAVEDLDDLIRKRKSEGSHLIEWEDAVLYIEHSSLIDMNEVDKDQLKTYILKNSCHAKELAACWKQKHPSKKQQQKQTNGNHDDYFHPICKILMEAMQQQKRNELVFSIIAGLLYRSLKFIHDDTPIKVSYEIRDKDPYKHTIEVINKVVVANADSLDSDWLKGFDIGISAATTTSENETIKIIYFRCPL